MSTEIRTKDDSDGKMLGFAIAGEDRRFYPADIQWYTDGSVDNRNQPKYQRNVLVLSSPFVPEPVHYRYAWARNPMSNLVNGSQRSLGHATQRRLAPGRDADPDPASSEHGSKESGQTHSRLADERTGTR